MSNWSNWVTYPFKSLSKECFLCSYQDGEGRDEEALSLCPMKFNRKHWKEWLKSLNVPIRDLFSFFVTLLTCLNWTETITLHWFLVWCEWYSCRHCSRLIYISGGHTYMCKHILLLKNKILLPVAIASAGIVFSLRVCVWLHFGNVWSWWHISQRELPQNMLWVFSKAFMWRSSESRP